MLVLAPLALLALAPPSVGVFIVSAPHMSEADQLDVSMRLVEELGGFQGVTVAGGPDVWDVVGAEEMARCRTDLACMSELAPALGVDVLLVPSAEEVSAEYHVRVQRIEGAEQPQILDCQQIAVKAEDVAETLRLCVLRHVTEFSVQQGTLRIETDEDEVTVLIDGQPGEASSLVAAGVHTVDVQKEGFRGTTQLVEVPADGERVVEAGLKPTDEYLEGYVLTAWLIRGSSFGLVGSGLLLSGVGAATLGATFVASQVVNAAITAYNEQPVRTVEERDALDLQKNLVNFGLLPTGIVISLIGPVVLGAGAVLFFVGDSPGRYE